MTRSDTLVIDIDGTLIRNDMTHELLLMAIFKHPFRLLSLLYLAFTSKAKLKAVLVDLVGGQMDTNHLPFNETVMETAKSHKNKGGEVVLCSGSEQTLVKKIASHFDWVDKAFGSTSDRNLTDSTKAQFLEDTYPDGFTYIGNSHQDFPVWEKATNGLAVNAPNKASQVKTSSGANVETIVPKQSSIKPLLKVMRLHQWAKNALIFVIPGLVIKKLTTIDIVNLIPGFIAMGLLASGTYIFNDLLDIQSDRKHATKHKRPFASGTLSIGKGIVAMVVCILTAAIISAFLPITFGLILGLYLVTTLLYSVFLKRKAIVDVFTLAFLFTIRVLAGAAIVGETASPWLISFVFAFFLSLSLTKRYTELVKLRAKNKTTMSGRGYTTEDSPLILSFGTIATAIAMLSFVLYGLLAVEPVLKSQVSIFIIGAVLAYWLMRMWLLSHRGDMNDDPILYAVTDSRSILAGLIVLIIVVAEQLVTWPALF